MMRTIADTSAAVDTEFIYDMCFAEGVTYDLDTWNEKITDSLNYLFLLNAIVKEETDY